MSSTRHVHEPDGTAVTPATIADELSEEGYA